MKTFYKDTKTRTFLRFGNDYYCTNHDWNDTQFTMLHLDQLSETTLATIKNDFDWYLLGDFANINLAYGFYLATMRKKAEERKIQSIIDENKAIKFTAAKYENLAASQPIETTMENIKIVLDFLQLQNWGSWKLPVFTIPYKANQFNCDGITATTLTFATAVPGIKVSGFGNHKFKIGGKFGHLKEYIHVR